MIAIVHSSTKSAFGTFLPDPQEHFLTFWIRAIIIAVWWTLIGILSDFDMWQIVLNIFTCAYWLYYQTESKQFGTDINTDK